MGCAGGVNDFKACFSKLIGRKDFNMDKKRNAVIDAVKGLAILTVVLYHFGGILPYGYLGVDIFFVIGGYLLIQQLLSQFKDNSFNYWSFIFRKLVRLWPLILLASVVSLAAGYFLMLPDDYENLAESAIASSVFANNILQCITTKNYWDVVNLYKPLMHLWYIGILMQAYVVLPVVFMMLKYILGDAGKGIFAGTIGIAVISLILYLAPFFTTAWKFYYLPFRLFEMTAGGLIVFADLRLRIKQKKICVTCAITVMLVMLCSRTEIVSPSFMLLVTSGAAVIFVGCMKNFEFQNQIVTKIVNYGSIIGKYSYSIYIWHQIIVAFLFYSVFPKRDIKSFAVFAVMTIIISMISYHFIEVLLGQTLRSKKMEKIIIAGSTFAAAILCGVSFFIYNHAGGCTMYRNWGLTRTMYTTICMRNIATGPIHGTKHLKMMEDSIY